MAFESDQFLAALAAWIVAKAAALETPVAIKFETTPRELWIHRADEGAACASLFSVLRIYGSEAVSPVPTLGVMIQCMTIGPVLSAALSRAELLAGFFLDANGPLRDQTVGAFRLVGFDDFRPPAVIGRDAKDRVEVPFNFRAIYHAA